MKRPAKNGDEQDCFYSRKAHGYLQRAGKASRIKRRARRRERRAGNQIIDNCETINPKRFIHGS